MTQLHGPRSGDLVRTRRRDGLPAGSPELRLHRDHGLEHGREPPGRVPVGDGGQGARRARDPRRPALHAHERDGDASGSASAPAPTSRSSAGSSTTSSSTSAEFEEYVKHYTNAPVIIDEDFADTEDLDGFFSGWDPEEGKYDPTTLAVRGHGGARLRPASVRRRRAGEQSGHGGHGGGAPARRAARGGPDAPAPALRLPAAEAALRAATRPSSSPRTAAAASRTSSRRRRRSDRQLRAARRPARSATRSAGRSTRSASSTSAPRRSSSSCSATWAGRAAGSSRCAGTPRSRARPTSRRCTTSCRATCRCRTPSSTAASTSTSRRTRAPTGWWGHFDAYWVSLMKAYFGEHATAENDWLLREAAADRRRQPRLPDDARHARRQGQGLHRSPARTRPSATRTRACTGARWRSSTGSSCATWSRSSRPPSGTTARRSSRAS